MNSFLQQYVFLHQLAMLPCVDRIILYGSRARADNQQRSDIDLAIDCPRATGDDWLTVLDIIEEADTLLKIDCVRFDTLNKNSALVKSIIQDGVEIYRKSI